MEKITKGYFGDEIAICGCTKADNAYYKRLYKSFTGNGVTVYGLPTVPVSDLDFETYPDLDALPHIPSCAYILCDKQDTPALLEDLKAHGVKKILFYSKKEIPEGVLEDCEKSGIEVRAGCPLMLYAGGPCALHASIAGVGEERKK